MVRNVEVSEDDEVNAGQATWTVNFNKLGHGWSVREPWRDQICSKTKLNDDIAGRTKV